MPLCPFNWLFPPQKHTCDLYIIKNNFYHQIKGKKDKQQGETGCVARTMKLYCKAINKVSEYAQVYDYTVVSLKCASPE